MVRVIEGVLTFTNTASGSDTEGTERRLRGVDAGYSDIRLYTWHPSLWLVLERLRVIIGIVVNSIMRHADHCSFGKPFAILSREVKVSIPSQISVGCNNRKCAQAW